MPKTCALKYTASAYWWREPLSREGSTASALAVANNDLAQYQLAGPNAAINNSHIRPTSSISLEYQATYHEESNPDPDTHKRVGLNVRPFL